MSNAKLMWIATDMDGKSFAYKNDPGEPIASTFPYTLDCWHVPEGTIDHNVPPGHKAPITITIGTPIDCRPKPPLVFDWQVIGDIEVCVCEGYTANIRPSTVECDGSVGAVWHDRKLVDEFWIDARGACEKLIRTRLGRN